MSSPNVEPVKETELSVLKEILKWVKFSGMNEVKNVLTTALDNGQKRSVYQLSDGTKGIVEIGKLVGIKSTATVFKLWKQWTKMGLGESVPVAGGSRFRRSFDLEEFGLGPEAPVSEVEGVEHGQPGSATSSGLEEFQRASGGGNNE